MTGYDLPIVNACLNGSAAILLLIGYVAIKRRYVTVHKVAMLTALAVSAMFLAGYLYYHIAVRGGQATRYDAQGWERAGYLALLLSHTVLAAVAAPLALVTATLGCMGRLKSHVWIARVTLPIWLYVSLTGVSIYWILKDHYPTAK